MNRVCHDCFVTEGLCCCGSIAGCSSGNILVHTNLAYGTGDVRMILAVVDVDSIPIDNITICIQVRIHFGFIISCREYNRVIAVCRNTVCLVYGDSATPVTVDCNSCGNKSI